MIFQKNRRHFILGRCYRKYFRFPGKRNNIALNSKINKFLQFLDYIVKMTGRHAAAQKGIPFD